MENLVNAAFWRGKKVFLTGHTGFKGAWLSLWLQQMGADVVGYALPPTTDPSLYQAAGIKDCLVQSHMGDVRDQDSLTQAMRDCAPDVVFHLAAQALVLPSFNDPSATFATNVQGTVHVLEAIRQCPSVRVALMITSDKCYDNREWVWGYRECDPMGGKDPYSASKGCAELVTASYRASFFDPAHYDRHGVCLASVRAGNVIGGGDWADWRLIPDLVRGVLTQKPVLIRNPLATRPGQHVLEPLSGYLCLAAQAWDNGAACAEGWNFGPADEAARPVEWVANQFAAEWGVPADQVWTTDSRSFPKESTYLKLDISKAAARLGWVPRWTASQCLPKVVGWYRRFAAGEAARDLMLKDLAEYHGL